MTRVRLNNRQGVARLVIIAALVSSASAHAQPTEQQKAEALELLATGNRDYEAKRYDAAIESYRAGYEQTGAPGFLFSMAQAFRLNNDCARALTHYERFLNAAPETEKRTMVESLIREMKLCVDEHRSRALRAANREAIRSAPTTPTPTPTETARGGSLRTFGVITSLAGLALVGTGTYYAVDARSQSRQLSGFSSTWGEQQIAIERRGQQSESRAIVLMSAGGVVLAGGAVLYVLGSKPRSSGADAPRVGVFSVSGGATITWSDTF